MNTLEKKTEDIDWQKGLPKEPGDYYCDTDRGYQICSLNRTVIGYLEWDTMDLIYRWKKFPGEINGNS